MGCSTPTLIVDHQFQRFEALSQCACGPLSFSHGYQIEALCHGSHLALKIEALSVQRQHHRQLVAVDGVRFFGSLNGFKAPSSRANSTLIFINFKRRLASRPGCFSAYSSS